MNYVAIKDRQATVSFENSDSGNHHAILEELAFLLEKDFKSFTFDFSKVSITSNIIGLIIGIVKTLAVTSKVKITNLNDEGKEIIDKLDLQDLFVNTLVIE